MVVRWQSLLVATLASLPTAFGRGGELASLTVPLFTSLANHTHRQDVCHRYDLFRAGKVGLREALSGVSLQPLMALGDFFNYDYEKGIHSEDPGLMADLMDALAERANFTWRDSFAVMEEPEVLNQTWTNMLLWGIENYDVAVNWWDQSVERMEKGAAYIEPWFDGSLILVDQEDPPVDVNTIYWFNWLSPFEISVWFLILFTILLSALVYQFIEFMSDERQERSITQWFSDNLYLSCLNFTQNFEYAPNSVAGRLFAVSMGMWALVMTATYTANLASLFVQDQRLPTVVDSIEQAILMEIPICTMGLTNSDSIIQERYKDAKRKPKATELEAYQALRRGECGLVAAYKDNWLGYQGNSKYNPECDLEWVGRVVSTIKSGFAVKADAGHLCSSLIRDVLNLHMTELISDGILTTTWEKHRAKTKDVNCEAEEASGRRRLTQSQSQSTSTPNSHRKLKGAKSAAAASTAAGSSNASLTLQQMIGTFTLHWATMAAAVLISTLSHFYHKRSQGIQAIEKERVTYRKHGPIIGSPPRVNTSVSRYVGPPERSQAFRFNYEPSDNDHKNSTRRGDTTTVTTGSNEGAPETGMERVGVGVSLYVGKYNEGNEPIQSIEERSQEPDWHRSHAQLQQKQHELSMQMNTVLAMLQEMREEQQQLLQRQQEQQSGHRLDIERARD